MHAPIPLDLKLHCMSGLMPRLAEHVRNAALHRPEQQSIQHVHSTLQVTGLHAAKANGPGHKLCASVSILLFNMYSFMICAEDASFFVECQPCVLPQDL